MVDKTLPKMRRESIYGLLLLLVRYMIDNPRLRFVRWTTSAFETTQLIGNPWSKTLLSCFVGIGSIQTRWKGIHLKNIIQRITKGILGTKVLSTYIEVYIIYKVFYMDKVFISKKEFMMMHCFWCARHNFPLNTYKRYGGKMYPNPSWKPCTMYFSTWKKKNRIIVDTRFHSKVISSIL